jgi:hypothetical protein
MGKDIGIIARQSVHCRGIKDTARRNVASIECARVAVVASCVVSGIGTIPINTLIDRTVNAIITFRIALTLGRRG